MVLALLFTLAEAIESLLASRARLQPGPAALEQTIDS
jgi:hypothetical protein